LFPVALPKLPNKQKQITYHGRRQQPVEQLKAPIYTYAVEMILRFRTKNIGAVIEFRKWKTPRYGRERINAVKSWKNILLLAIWLRSLYRKAS
jgi:hypothetical protein